MKQEHLKKQEFGIVCSIVDFRVVMALFLVSAGQTLVLAEGPTKTETKSAVEKAKQKLDDYLLDMESIGKRPIDC